MFLVNSIRRCCFPSQYQAANTDLNSSSLEAIKREEDVPDNVDEIGPGMEALLSGPYLKTDKALASALQEAQWADPNCSANRRSDVPLSKLCKYFKTAMKATALEFLSEGGFGLILKTTDSLGDTYAVKVVTSEYSGNQQLELWQAQTAREVFYLSNYAHTHIVKAFDIHWAITDPAAAIPNTLYLAMELLEVDLITVLNKYTEPMNGPVLNRLARQITSALEYLHRNGVVHHDIKPLNIMMANGRVPGWNEPQRKLVSATWKLIDLGLCRRYGRPDELEPSYRQGTGLFMSPEKKMLDTPYNPYMADSYAWGLTLFLALVGTDYVRRYTDKKRIHFYSILAVQPVGEYFAGLKRTLKPMEKAISTLILPGEEARLSIGELNTELQALRR